MRLPVLDRRRAGVLLHLGSLEAALGRGGRAFIDWLAQGGFSVWQILPAGPTGPDGSPYWVRSDFAGNCAFLDIAELPDVQPAEYAAFLDENRQWLDDYALFEVLSGLHGGAAWWTWPAELRAHARSRGVRIVGDLPFYVAPHSAETWSRPEQFQLQADGRPAAVAGVPPDYFSQTGQLWGNPLYDWQAMRRDNFAYWRARVLEQLERVDLLRIDHFRALAAHWAVPAGAADARGGAWHLTPGEDLLRLLMDELGDLPILAEDLGVITDDVVALRKGFGLPGMRVLQFAFSGEGDNPHLPHMHEHDSVVYTGTHDNDTTLGWYRSLDDETRRSVDAMLRAAPGSMPDALIREALGSVGQLAVIPAQDLLALGSEARLNTPGTVQGNWSWTLPSGALTAPLARHYAQLNRMYGRA